MKSVIDASFIAALLLPDESSEQVISHAAAMRDEGASVPAIWPFEVTNILLMAERRKRIVAAEVAQLMDAIEQFSVSIEPSPTSKQRSEMLHLAREHGLTAYDAAYLELAMRLGASLATLDNSLARSAKAEGVKLAVA